MLKKIKSKIHRSGRKHVAQSTPIPVEPKLPDLRAEPEKRGIGERGLGLKNKLKAELIKEHCGDNPSVTQLLLVDALVSLVLLSREKELSPRDLASNIGSQKSIVKLLKELRGSQPPVLVSPRRMSLDELEEEAKEIQDDIYRDLASLSPSDRLQAIADLEKASGIRDGETMTSEKEMVALLAQDTMATKMRKRFEQVQKAPKIDRSRL